MKKCPSLWFTTITLFCEGFFYFEYLITFYWKPFRHKVALLYLWYFLKACGGFGVDEKKIQQKCLLLLLLLNTLKAFTNMYSLLMIFNCTLVCSKTQRSIVLLYLMQQARIFLLWIKDLKNKKQWENTNTLTWFNQLTLLRSVNTGQCAK